MMGAIYTQLVIMYLRNALEPPHSERPPSGEKDDALMA